MKPSPDALDALIAAGENLAHRRANLLAQLAATRAEITHWASDAHSAGLGRRRIARVLGVTPQAVAGLLAGPHRVAEPAAAGEETRSAAGETPAVPTLLPLAPPASGTQIGLWT